MNRNRLAAAVIAATTIFPVPAVAHDKSLHKGKPTEGQILSVQPGRFSMKTAAGEKTVTLGDKTAIEVGNKAGKGEDLRAGDHVAVFGTKLPGGEIVAKEVLVLPDSPQGGQTPGEHE